MIPLPHITARVHNRGTPPASFINEMVAWAKTAPDELFATNAAADDIYVKVKPELGPWKCGDGFILHRKAVMMEVLRVLAGFESSWKWNEGVDASKAIANTTENAEAGAWQMSYDARKITRDLADLLTAHGIHDGIEFQSAMKGDHALAMESEVRLLRHTTRHNGPLYKGAARKAVWPRRPKLWGAEESIYPHLSRGAVAEWEALLS